MLVPTLLYAQDEIGYLSDEVIAGDRAAARAHRPRSTQRDQLLLHADDQAARKIQRAGLHQYRVHAARWRRTSGSLRKKLGIGHKGTTPDGMFSLEEVECIGACSWAPAVQVNYDFHENLTPEKMDKVLEKLQEQVRSAEITNPEVKSDLMTF